MLVRVISIRNREPADVEMCVRALATVHQTSGYPTNWPRDPALWLTPADTVAGWVATTDDLPLAGHVILRRAGAAELTAEVSRLFVVPAARRQGVALALLRETMRWATVSGTGLVLEVTEHSLPARALYEQSGFRMIGTEEASWTAPDGGPIVVRRYAWSGVADLG